MHEGRRDLPASRRIPQMRRPVRRSRREQVTVGAKPHFVYAASVEHHCQFPAGFKLPKFGGLVERSRGHIAAVWTEGRRGNEAFVSESGDLATSRNFPHERPFVR